MAMLDGRLKVEASLGSQTDHSLRKNTEIQVKSENQWRRS